MESPNAAMVHDSIEPQAEGDLRASLDFCISYASLGDARVMEAKAELEARGHHVFYGQDISATADEDWRKQWCIGCSKADFAINFLSEAYIRSDSCAEEWNFSRSNKGALRIVNLVVGGRESREQLLAVPLEEVANKGGMAIRLYFETGGQAVSVYGEDDIAEKILAQAMPNTVDDRARRQKVLEDARRRKDEAASRAPPEYLRPLLQEQGLQQAAWPPPLPEGCDYHLFISKHEASAKADAEVVGRVLRDELGMRVWLSQFEQAAGRPIDEAGMQMGVRRSAMVVAKRGSVEEEGAEQQRRAGLAG